MQKQFEQLLRENFRFGRMCEKMSLIYQLTKTKIKGAVYYGQPKI